MRIGILFPVVIFITAVIFLAWFFVGGYAAPGWGINEKNDPRYADRCHRGICRHAAWLVVNATT